MMARTTLTRWLALPVMGLLLTACQPRQPLDYSGPVAGWDEPTGTKGGGQFTPLTQINADNVKQLKVAWTYDSPDFSRGTDASGSPHAKSNVVVTPVIANGKMLLCTPHHRVVALDPRTGKELWNFDPKMNQAVPSHFCRGVSVWHEPQPVAGQACQSRVLSSSGDGRLIALDLETGKLCEDFGQAGTVDMKAHLGPLNDTEYYNTAHPFTVNDLVLSGHAMRDSFRTLTGGGVVRAWNVRSGELVWAFDPVGPKMKAVTAEEAKAGAVFTRGTPNVWSFMSADVENNLVFLPTGNAAPDGYKGPPREIDHYGSSVVALNALTGQVVWRFQTVHHDLWDYDVGSQPVLYMHQDKTPAVAVSTKHGHIYLLNRLTGEPLFPVEQRPVPQTDVPGETTSPTQPFPTLPLPILNSRLTVDDLSTLPFVTKGCKETFDALRNEGMFTPPSLRGTLQSPGIAGGYNWGAGSINPQTGVYVANFMNMPFIITLKPRTDHRKPEENNDAVDWTSLPQYESPYELKRVPFLSTRGVPCVKSPWGSTIAIDTATGKELWRRPMGTLAGQIPLIGSLFNVGTPGSGGTLQTATGLVFTAFSTDEHMRALDVRTGKEIWTVRLPFSAHATPMSYRLAADEKQFLVIATGGTAAMDPKVGNTLVAFTLTD